MKLKKIWHCTWNTLIWPAGLYLLFFALVKILGTGSNFGGLSSMTTVLKQALLTSMIALAMSCNMINGRWDFSMGIIMVTTSFIVSPIVIGYELGSWGVLVLCVLVCSGLCMINCLLYLIFKIPTLIISFGVLLIYETLELTINGGGGAALRGMAYTQFGRSPHIYILCAVMFLIFYVLWSHTGFGYNVRSLGNSQIISSNVGVKENKNVILCYLLCGVFLGVASCINVSMKGNIESSSTFNNNMSLMFIAFPPVFIGLFLSKYTNFTLGVFIGSFCIKLLTQGLLAVGLPTAAQNIGVGLFLFLFIGLTTNQGRIADWQARRLKVKKASRQ